MNQHHRRAERVHEKQPTSDWQRVMQAARQMPVLDHYRHGRHFNILESDVANYLCQLPEFRQLAFNIARRNGAIVFRSDGRWVGADFNQLDA
jgi:hypothetical protein